MVMIETHGSTYSSRVSLLVDGKECSLVLKLQEHSAAPTSDYPRPLPQGAVAACTPAHITLGSEIKGTEPLQAAKQPPLPSPLSTSGQVFNSLFIYYLKRKKKAY